MKALFVNVLGKNISRGAKNWDRQDSGCCRMNSIISDIMEMAF